PTSTGKNYMFLIEVRTRVFAPSYISPVIPTYLLGVPLLAKDLKTKHPFKHALSLPHIPTDQNHLIASLTVVLDMIKSFSCGTSYGRDGLHVQHLLKGFSGVAAAISNDLVASITRVVNLFLDEKYPKMLGECIASAHLMPLVKPSGGTRLIVSGVGVSGNGEAILHAVNWLIEDHGDDMGLSMLLVDFKNGFNLVDRETGYLDDGTIFGDTLVAGKVLELIMVDGPHHGLHLNVEQTDVFWPNKDPRSSVDFDFSSDLVMKGVVKSVELMNDVAKINDPQCELLLLRACVGVSKLYFVMRIGSLSELNGLLMQLFVMLRSVFVTSLRLGFGDWQWRLATLPIAYGGLGVYSAGDVLNFAFLVSKL
ncbi:hypothetical protein Tco_0116198, partial [Tanacetum coccineum]